MLHEIMEIILNTCNICSGWEGHVSCVEENCPIYLIKEKVETMIDTERG